MLKNSKGSILISAYMIVVVFLVLSGAFFSHALSERRFSEMDRREDGGFLCR